MQTKPATLSRAEITAAIQRECGLSYKISFEFVEQIISHMREAMARGENVKITHFGTFRLNDKDARMGRDPRNGVEHSVKARRVVTFKASKTLKARVGHVLPTSPKSKT